MIPNDVTTVYDNYPYLPNLPVLYDDYFCLDQILNRWLEEKSFAFHHITMEYSTSFVDVPVLYDPDFAQEQYERLDEQPKYERFWKNEKKPIYCEECGDVVAYMHKSQEPESPVHGAYLDLRPWSIEIIFCPECDEKFGKDWDNKPFSGEYDDVNY
jgi:hypothetical protein